jgi:uncharacterized damage-inducible protein DinB
VPLGNLYTVNEALLEAFRHNAWATKHLLASCRGLSEEQLTSSAVGTYGGILATINHLIGTDARYLLRLAGSAPEWAVNRNETDDVAQLEARAEETARLWEQFLSGPLDADRVLILDEGTYECPASVAIAQALHHGSAHREQICAILTGFGVQPPDVQPWAYADATGRARHLTPGESEK